MSASALQNAPRPSAIVPIELGVASGVWLATDLGAMPETCISTGWEALDAELPGGGWPCNSIVECLSASPANFEWRLTTPALRTLVKEGKPAIAIGPPRQPNMPGLTHGGIGGSGLVWIKAEKPAERLWMTEQAIRANSAAAVLAWLPQARCWRKATTARCSCSGRQTPCCSPLPPRCGWWRASGWTRNGGLRLVNKSDYHAICFEQAKKCSALRYKCSLHLRSQTRGLKH